MSTVAQRYNDFHDAYVLVIAAMALEATGMTGPRETQKAVDMMNAKACRLHETVMAALGQEKH